MAARGVKQGVPELLLLALRTQLSAHIEEGVQRQDSRREKAPVQCRLAFPTVSVLPLRLSTVLGTLSPIISPSMYPFCFIFHLMELHFSRAKWLANSQAARSGRTGDSNSWPSGTLADASSQLRTWSQHPQNEPVVVDVGQSRTCVLFPTVSE